MVIWTIPIYSNEQYKTAHSPHGLLQVSNNLTPQTLECNKISNPKDKLFELKGKHTIYLECKNSTLLGKYNTLGCIGLNYHKISSAVIECQTGLPK